MAVHLFVQAQREPEGPIDAARVEKDAQVC